MENAGPSSKKSELSRYTRKHGAILGAATEVFLRAGFLGTNMEEIAALSGVSKQTVYKHFSSKEALFIEIVTTMTKQTGDAVHNDLPEPEDDVADYLVNYAYRQLRIVLTPRVMQLRRLVIGEAGRFPELAKILYERGPLRAISLLAAQFSRLAEQDRLSISDPEMAATHFNWLVMSDPLNRAMLLGDEAIPDESELRKNAESGVQVFLAAYGKQA